MPWITSLRTAMMERRNRQRRLLLLLEDSVDDNPRPVRTRSPEAEAHYQTVMARMEADDREYSTASAEILTRVHAHADAAVARHEQQEADKAAFWDEIHAKQIANLAEIDAMRTGEIPYDE